MLMLHDQLTIQALRDSYLKGVITPEEVIDHIIEVAQRDEAYHIWITPPNKDLIMPYVEQLATMSPQQYPLWGIPFAIKDNIDVAHIPTTAACPAYSYTPTSHATVVERLITAGAIPVGKTNLDQFATGLVGVRSPYGEVHNALQPSLISGGSSSGSAVAVARGHVAFSLGTDTAGSGRVPAALNGLVGYKPSVGAWSVKGVVPACKSIDCVTVFAWSSVEAKLIDQCVRGIDENDAWSMDRPIIEGKLGSKIILPSTDLIFFGHYREQYHKAWQTTLQYIDQLQLPVQYVELELFQEAAKMLYDGPFVEERWAALGSFVEAHETETLDVTTQILKSGQAAQYSAAAVFQAQHKMKELKHKVAELLENGVLILPTVGGTYSREQLRQEPIKYNSDMGLYTNHCNLLDLAAIAIPSIDADEKLPFGITLFSLPELESALFDLAKKFMAVTTKPSNAIVQSTAIPVAVCGLHMRGMPLEQQMKDCGAIFVKETTTAPKYKLYKLGTTPSKPGLVKVEQGGSSISLEIWHMPLHSFGAFTAQIPAPLGIGKIELENGTEVSGFLCEGYVLADAEEISELGSWRAV